jgi:ABC-type lipoprotein release transport system permease subunit
LVASQLGVRDEPVVPLLVVVIVVAGTLIVANALASLPGQVAARTRPAEILRAE